jgi:DNA polymerase III gamma/tau subunit
MPLHTDLRPKTLDDFLGNASLKDALKSALEKNIQVYLITGKSGCGKTTIGRIIANYLGINEYHVNIINAADSRGIDAIREIIVDSKNSPLYGTKKIYILEEAHQISVPAQESLLQFLEEPPKNVYIVLTTTNPEKLKDTLKRRCFVGEVKPILQSDVVKLLKTTKKKISRKVFEKILSECEGSAGKILKVLDTIDGLSEEDALSMISSASEDNAEIIQICRVLVDKRLSPNEKWNKCRNVLQKLEIPPESARHIVLSYLNKCILNSNQTDLVPMLLNFSENYYDAGLSGLILSVYSSIFNE